MVQAQKSNPQGQEFVSSKSEEYIGAVIENSTLKTKINQYETFIQKLNDKICDLEVIFIWINF